MPEYALVQDGEIVNIGPEPDSWENEDGTTTSTPIDTPSDPKVLAKLGYLPIEDKDAEAPDGHVQDGWEFKIQKTKVVRTPRFVEQPVATGAPSLEDVGQRLLDLEEALTDLRQRFEAMEQRTTTLEGNISESEMPSFRAALQELQTTVRDLRRG